MPSMIRDVSPLGASRFELPYYPGSESSASGGKRSHTSKPSIASSAVTQSTTPTSVDTLPSYYQKDLRALPTPPSEREIVFPAKASLDQGFNIEKLRSDSLSNVDDDSHECPDGATLAAVREFPVYDAQGNSVPFSSLYEPSNDDPNAPRQRHLLIFVRYFYCCACTSYLQSLVEGIPANDIRRIDPPTTITIIGCGQPDIIPHYKSFTGCDFPMYADPSRVLFKKLGMGVTTNMGKKPEYMDTGLLSAVGDEVKLLRKSLKDPEGLRKRDLLRGGNPMQIGGEFLFDGGEVVWCHRMKDYRGHAEVKALRRVLGLEE